MTQLVSVHHSNQVSEALRNRRKCELLIVGNDHLRTHSSSLWIFSPFIRSIVASVENVEENVIIIPDFSCRDIKAGLDIIETDVNSDLVFNSSTRNLHQTLGINLLVNGRADYEAKGDQNKQQENSDIQVKTSYVRMPRLRLDSNKVTETDVEEKKNTDDDELLKPSIKVEHQYPDDDDDDKYNRIQNILNEINHDFSYSDEDDDDDDEDEDGGVLIMDQDLSDSEEEDAGHDDDDEGRECSSPMLPPEDQATMDNNMTATDSKLDSNKRASTEIKTETKSNNNMELLKEVQSHLIKRNGVWRCKTCDRTFQGKSNAESHAEIHVAGLSYSCKLCDETFNTRSRLAQHKFNKHGKQNKENRKYTCTQCDYKTTMKNSLKKHIQSKHKGRPKSNSKSIDNRVHEGIKYPCNQCDYQCTLKGSLKTHMIAKHSDTILKCDSCNYQTKWRNQYYKHKKTHNIR